VIIQPVLAYIVFSLQGGTVEKVKNAVLGFFSNEQIQAAKDCLWEKGDKATIGEKQRRKDSAARTEKEANVLDIISALSKLDEKDQMPCIAIDAYSLHVIPRSHPEELCDISLVDRLNRIEKRMSTMQEILDTVVCENISLKEKEIHTRPLYSAVVNRAPQIPQTIVTQVPDNHVMQSGQVNTAGNQGDTNSRNQLNVPPRSQTGNSRGRGRGYGSGGNRVGYTNTIGRAGSQETLSASGSQTSLLDAGSDDGASGSFTLQRQQRRKQRQNNRSQVVTGKGQPNDRIKGAPEPVRHLFIYRVDKETQDDAIHSYITENGFSIKDLSCVSNINAKFKSYKLTVPVSEFKYLFDENLWPPGVRVRQYIAPRRDQTFDIES
jgi:hypothetical protein